MKTNLFKKYIIAVTASAMLFGMTACINEGSPYTKKSDVKLASYDECPVELKAEVIWNRKVRVTLTNNGNKDYMWGNPYQLEYRFDGDWYEVPHLPDHAWTLEGILLGGRDSKIGNTGDKIGNTGEEIDRLDQMFGDIPAGHYRIIKSLSVFSFTSGSAAGDYYIAGEFDLDKPSKEKEPLEKTKVDKSLIIPAEKAGLKLESLTYQKDSKTLSWKALSSYNMTNQYLELQKDGEWYAIPDLPSGGGYEYGEQASSYNTELYLNDALEPGHYRLALEVWHSDTGLAEDFVMEYVIYEFDLDKENKIIAN